MSFFSVVRGLLLVFIVVKSQTCTSTNDNSCLINCNSTSTCNNEALNCDVPQSSNSSSLNTCNILCPASDTCNNAYMNCKSSKTCSISCGSVYTTSNVCENVYVNATNSNELQMKCYSCLNSHLVTGKVDNYDLYCLTKQACQNLNFDSYGSSNVYCSGAGGEQCQSANFNAHSEEYFTIHCSSRESCYNSTINVAANGRLTLYVYDERSGRHLNVFAGAESTIEIATGGTGTPSLALENAFINASLASELHIQVDGKGSFNKTFGTLEGMTIYTPANGTTSYIAANCEHCLSNVTIIQPKIANSSTTLSVYADHLSGVAANDLYIDGQYANSLTFGCQSGICSDVTIFCPDQTCSVSTSGSAILQDVTVFMPRKVKSQYFPVTCADSQVYDTTCINVTVYCDKTLTLGCKMTYKNKQWKCVGTSNCGLSGSSSGGSSTNTSTLVISILIPLIVVGLLVMAFIWYRRRKRQTQSGSYHPMNN